MQRPHGRRSRIVVAATIGLVASMAATGPASAASVSRSSRSRPKPRTSCCLPPMAPPDIVERYAADRGVPGFADLLRKALLPTVAACSPKPRRTPARGGTRWRQARGPACTDRRTTRSHQQPDLRQPNRCLRPRGAVGRDDRAGGRAWRQAVADGVGGGRNGTIAGPTVDFRTFLSGRGVTTNYVSPTDRPPLITAFGLQYDQVTLAPATGWTNVPASNSLALETHMRVLDFGADKYGLDAYIYDSTDDGAVNYDRVLFSRGKDGANEVADLAEGELADVKVTIVGGAPRGSHRGMLVKVEELTDDASQVRLFHTSVTAPTRRRADWPGEPGFEGDFDEYVARRSRPRRLATSRSSRRASSARRPTSSRACTGRNRITRCSSMIETYQPDLALVGYPVTDEFQHQFLGLVTPTVPDGSTTRRTTTSARRNPPDGGSRFGRASSAGRTRAPTPPCAWPGSCSASRKT